MSQPLWQKSTFSGNGPGNDCLEVGIVCDDTSWQNSSHSGGMDGNECVELTGADGMVCLRESDDPHTVIATTPRRLAVLVRALKGEPCRRARQIGEAMWRSGWQKSSFSASTSGNECVELARIGDRVRLRESDVPGTFITTTRNGLAVLMRTLKAGELHR